MMLLRHNFHSKDRYLHPLRSARAIGPSFVPSSFVIKSFCCQHVSTFPGQRNANNTINDRSILRYEINPASCNCQSKIWQQQQLLPHQSSSHFHQSRFQRFLYSGLHHVHRLGQRNSRSLYFSTSSIDESSNITSNITTTTSKIDKNKSISSIASALLDAPVGTLTEKNWMSAEYCMTYLIQYELIPQPRKIVPALKNVQLLLHLFTRLLKEQNYVLDSYYSMETSPEAFGNKEMNSNKYVCISLDTLPLATSFVDDILLKEIVLKWQRISRVYFDGLTRVRHREFAPNSFRAKKREMEVIYEGFYVQQEGNMDVHTSHENFYETESNWDLESLESDEIQRLLKHCPIGPEKLLRVLDQFAKVGNKRAHQRNAYVVRVSTEILSLILDVTFRCSKYNASINCFDKAITMAELSESILFRIIDYKDTNSNQRIPSDNTNHVDSRYRQFQRFDLVEEVEDSYDNEQLQMPHEFSATAYNLNHVLAAYCASEKTENAERVMQEMLEKYQSGKDQQSDPSRFLLDKTNGYNYPVPDIVSYTTILSSYSRRGEMHASERILHQWIEHSQQSQKYPDAVPPLPYPPVTIWNNVLAGWGKYKNPELAAERAEQLLMFMMMVCATDKKGQTGVDMYDMYGGVDDGNFYESQNVKPNLFTFNLVLAATARAGQAEKCYSIFNDMKAICTAAGTLELNNVSYSTVLNSFAKAGRAELAEEFLERMVKEYDKQKNLEVKPTIKNFTSVMEAYSSNLDPTRYYNDSSSSSSSAKVEFDSYISKARQLLTRICELDKDGFFQIGPDTVVFNVMLTCLYRYCQLLLNNKSTDGLEKYETSREIIKEMEQLLQQMKHGSPSFCSSNTTSTSNSYSTHLTSPDFRSYSIIIMTCLFVHNQKRASLKLSPRDKITSTKKKGIDLHSNSHGDNDDILVFTIDWASRLLYEAWEGFQVEILQNSAVLGTRKKALLRPDARSLQSIFVGFGRAGRPELVDFILTQICEQALLAHAQKSASVSSTTSSEMIEIKPRAATFGALIGAWKQTHNPQAAKRADALLQLLEKMHRNGVSEEGPDHLMYKTVLECWAMSPNPENYVKGARRAYEILSFKRAAAVKENSPFNSLMLPDAKCYNLVMRAFVNANSPMRAEGVLREMIQDYKVGNKLAKPDAHSFNTVLSGWSKIGGGSCLTHAKKLFDEINHLHRAGEIDMNIITYNTYLNCLASANCPIAADEAKTLLRYIEQRSAAGDTSCQPTIRTYGTIVKAFVRCNKVKEADEFLYSMYQKYSSTKDINVKPTKDHFEFVMNAWKSSAMTLDHEFVTQKVKKLESIKGTLFPT